MPFYEYECAVCKFYTEVMQKIAAAPLRKCPSCGQSAMKKLISAPNFRLKGGGWYETDFKSDNERKRNLASEKDADVKPAEAKADAKSDAKPVESKPAAEKPVEAKPAARKDSPQATAKSKTRPKAKPAAKRRARR